METLPLEVVETISQYLTPQDLERCSAVSHYWRELFNQDLLWKPRCDPALEEHLRKIPCTVEPSFVVPEEEEVTLPPICHWKKAFIQEARLRRNWKHNVCKKPVCFPGPKLLRKLSDCEFLTDTLLATHCLNAIEIWDVTPSPPVLLMKSDPSIIVGRWLTFTVLSNYLIVLKQPSSVQVFILDLPNQRIFLEHEIKLESYGYCVVKLTDQSTCVCVVSAKNNMLSIFDLKTGEKIKDEVCPVERVNIVQMQTTCLSDDILVLFENYENGKAVAYIYSTKQLQYISQIDIINPFECEISKHYLAYISNQGPVVVDYLNPETNKFEFSSEIERVVDVKAFNNCFIFLKYNDDKSLVDIFSLTNKTVSTIFESKKVLSTQFTRIFVKIVHNKFLFVFSGIDKVVFELVGNSLRQVDMTIPILEEIFNNCLTRSLKSDIRGNLVLSYYW